MQQKLYQFRMLLLLALLAVAGGGSAATYKLQKVTSVQDGGLYVFEQDGHVMGATVSSNALQTTTTYNRTGLTGTEAYVWTLEAGTSGNNSGFYMRNVSKSSSFYLCNSSGTNVSFGAENSRSLWQFNFQTDETVIIQNLNNSSRFLGYTNSTSYAYKAYATSNLSSYPHAVVVYQLVDEASGGEDPTPVDATWSVSPASVTVTAGETATAEITTNYNGALSVATDDADVATATLSGKTLTVTGVAEGTATLTISGAATTDYNALSETVSVTVSAAPAVTEQWVETPITALTTSDVFLIVDKTSAKALPSTETSSSPSAVGVRLNADKTEVLGTVDDGLKWYFEDNDGSYVFHAYGDANSVLYINKSNTGVRINNGWNDASRPDLVYDSEAQKLKNQVPWDTEYRWIGVYNSQDWRCYTSATTANITNTVTAFYKRVDISGKEQTTTAFAESAYTFEQGSDEAAAFTGQTATVTDNAGAPVADAAVTYASSNADVAAVDASTGAVTLGTSVGTATITATYAGDDSYVGSTATYTITVEAAPMQLKQTASVVSGEKYAFVVSGKVSGIISANYGYLPTTDATVTDGVLRLTDEKALYTFTAVEGGYTIRDANGKYLYNSGSYNNFNVSATLPSQGGVWTVALQQDGTFKITNAWSGKYIQYSSSNGNYGQYSSETGTLPFLYTENPTEAPVVQVAVPEADKASGEYAYGTTVTLTQDNAAFIMYTTDGTTPSYDGDNGELYDTPIAIEGDFTLKAIAVDDDGNESEVLVREYTVTKPTAPVFSPAGGAVEAGTRVTVSTTESNVLAIIYTADGTDPDFAASPMVGTEYEGPITVTEGVTLKAVVVDENGLQSPVATATYTITVPSIGEGTGKFRKISSAEELTDGRYLIVYEEGSLVLDGARDNSTAGNMDAVGNTVEVTIEGDVIEGAEAAAFTYDATAKTLKGEGGLYIGQTSNANGLASNATTTYTNTISFDDGGNADIVSGGAYLRYNATSGQTRFRYYKSSSYGAQKPVTLYKEIKA
ncbi:MAG: chitobiase/beta-hexosaminidase C-terminal domain-containing protein, partial [Alloprevotella sp.]|nr:chitobiase/beta-hexosaminidase C-terminal domain-containing protein [Alloprevotella sp.]